MKPGAELSFRQNGFVSRIDLHGELQGQWRVLEILCCLLKLLQVQGVVEGAHVQQHRDSMFLEGLGSFLAKEALEGDVECRGAWSGSVIIHGW